MTTAYLPHLFWTKILSVETFLTATALWAYSADNKLMIFFLFYQKTEFTISRNCLHWKSDKTYLFGKNKKKYFNIYAVCRKFYPECSALSSMT